MISTLAIKQQQLANTYFKIGIGMIRILILGSCRVAPYISYLNEWNKQQPNGDMFTIYSIDPFNNNWNEKDERVDYLEALQKLETDERILEMLPSIDYFVHEWYANAGMFNCNKEAENNIYRYGLCPALDVCIPNFNDYFILFNDVVKFDVELRKKAMQDFNVTGKLSDLIMREIWGIGESNIFKFFEVCEKSDMPEMQYVFREQMFKKRFWWSYNHVSKHFTLAIFKILNDKYLKLDILDQFYELIGEQDMFANNYTKLTQYDIDCYGFDWGEEIVPLFS